MDVTEVGPVEVMEELEDAYQQKELRQWAAAEGREELQPLPWMLPAKQLMGKKLTPQWTRQHRAIVRSATLGAFPEQADLYEQGKVDSPFCPLCVGAHGTNRHVYWKCQSETCCSIRKKIGPLVVAKGTKSLGEYMRQGETATQEELLWSRGLMPDPCMATNGARAATWCVKTVKGMIWLDK